MRGDDQGCRSPKLPQLLQSKLGQTLSRSAASSPTPSGASSPLPGAASPVNGKLRRRKSEASLLPNLPPGHPGGKDVRRQASVAAVLSVLPLPISCASTVSMVGIRETKVMFRNALEEALSGKYVDGGTHNVVIICHGLMANKDSSFLPALAVKLAHKRLSSLRFDFSGNGESQGVLEYSPFSKEVSDLRAAVDFVRNTMGKTVLAIVGHAEGGTDVISYTGHWDDVPLVVNVAGCFDCSRGIVELFGADLLAKVAKLGQVQVTVKTTQGAAKMVVTKQSLADRKEMNLTTACGKITISEVLTVHGTADHTVPVGDAHLFARHIRQHNLQLVEGADHQFSTPAHLDLLVKRVVEFIKSNM